MEYINAGGGLWPDTCIGGAMNTRRFWPPKSSRRINTKKTKQKADSECVPPPPAPPLELIMACKQQPGDKPHTNTPNCLLPLTAWTCVTRLISIFSGFQLPVSFPKSLIALIRASRTAWNVDSTLIIFPKGSTLRLPRRKRKQRCVHARELCGVRYPPSRFRHLARMTRWFKKKPPWHISTITF